MHYPNLTYSNISLPLSSYTELQKSFPTTNSFNNGPLTSNAAYKIKQEILKKNWRKKIFFSQIGPAANSLNEFTLNWVKQGWVAGQRITINENFKILWAI